VEQLLKETEAYLEKLGVKLREQKELASKESDSVAYTDGTELAKEADEKGKNQVNTCSSTCFFVMNMEIFGVGWRKYPS
jgi:hypothetical protein